MIIKQDYIYIEVHFVNFALYANLRYNFLYVFQSYKIQHLLKTITIKRIIHYNIRNIIIYFRNKNKLIHLSVFLKRIQPPRLISTTTTTTQCPRTMVTISTAPDAPEKQLRWLIIIIAESEWPTTPALEVGHGIILINRYLNCITKHSKLTHC